jgi:hypothetical protein
MGKLRYSTQDHTVISYVISMRAEVKQTQVLYKLMTADIGTGAANYKYCYR